MAFKRPPRANEQDPFTDLLFNALLAFTFLFIVALIFLNPPAKTGIIDPKAEFIITTTWEEGSPDDVDTWVEDPDGNLIWFNSPSLGLMHLDRDDRGMTNDMLLVNGEEVINPLNQEIVTIRGFVEGEYVVNLHYYKSETDSPVTASVSVAKVNPSLEVVYFGNVELERQGTEATAVRFRVNKDGSIGRVTTLPKSIVTVEKI
ncbi:MAG: hypothetical protein ACU85V_12855 [Gammaproteobacteria bacterium]